MGHLERERERERKGGSTKEKAKYRILHGSKTVGGSLDKQDGKKFSVRTNQYRISMNKKKILQQ